MMDKKQLVESQKECASMLGMTLNEYKKYLKNAKVNEKSQSQQAHQNDFLKIFGIETRNLKLRKEV